MDNGWGVEVSGLDEMLESFDRFGRGLLDDLEKEAAEAQAPKTVGRLTETEPPTPVARGRLSNDGG